MKSFWDHFLDFNTETITGYQLTLSKYYLIFNPFLTWRCGIPELVLKPRLVVSWNHEPILSTSSVQCRPSMWFFNLNISTAKLIRKILAQCNDLPCGLKIVIVFDRLFTGNLMLLKLKTWLKMENVADKWWLFGDGH